MKLFNSKNDKRAAALRVMNAAVLVAVAVIAGVVVVNLVGHQLAYVGLWLMSFAFQLALGLAIGTVCYAIISKLVNMALDASELTLERVQVINPWRGVMN
jgi:hypothetical protein